jgi:hypothetical protein
LIEHAPDKVGVIGTVDESTIREGVARLRALGQELRGLRAGRCSRRGRLRARATRPSSPRSAPRRAHAGWHVPRRPRRSSSSRPRATTRSLDEVMSLSKARGLRAGLPTAAGLQPRLDVRVPTPMSFARYGPGWARGPRPVQPRRPSRALHAKKSTAT